MNLNPTIQLARLLADDVLSGDDKSARIRAADLKAALEEPQPVAPWTPWNSRSSIPAYKPGGAL